MIVILINSKLISHVSRNSLIWGDDFNVKNSRRRKSAENKKSTDDVMRDRAMSLSTTLYHITASLYLIRRDAFKINVISN